MTTLLPVRANDICFLGTVRACGAAGLACETVVYTWPGAGPWYSEASRWVADSHVIANPFAHAQRACEDLIAVAESVNTRRGALPLAIPSSDTALMFLLDHQARLHGKVRMMGGEGHVRGRLDVTEKHTCATMLAAGGVQIPKTFACLSHAEVEAVVEGVPYPCVYKPTTKDYGQTFYARHAGEKAVSVGDPGTLRRLLHQELDAGFRLVVQERVEFASVHDEIPCYVYVDEDHRIRMAATAVKHTIQPHPYGTATVLYLTWHPELLEHAQRVATALRWRGILMIEFIRDLKDGMWKVIEVNGRPWLFVDFFRRFGLNYLQYLGDDLRGDTSHWPALRVPTPEVLAQQPVHVSLPKAIEPVLAQLDRAPRVEDVVAFLDQLPGAKTLTFLDPTDPKPGHAELEALARQVDLPVGELVGAVERTLHGV